ncbi:hypothetical protein ACS0TY_027413 [Phlomoides rotata]
MEEMFTKFMGETTKFMGETKNFMRETRQEIGMVKDHVKVIERQVSQLATIVGSQHKQGQLPSNTELNPKEHCKAIKLRSGTFYNEPKMPVEDELEHAGVEEEKVETTQERVVEEEPEKKTSEEKLDQEANVHVPSHDKGKQVAHVPYPLRLKKNSLDTKFVKFLEKFKKIHINIPFVEALEQMPHYTKFLKDIMSNKRKMSDYETVNLTEECSAILQAKLPQKLKDPGSFTIPCKIGDGGTLRALCDLWASINLMPFSIFKKLGLGELKPTTISLQLADRSMTYPRGVIENVLVKVKKFIFPVDFVVLDMVEDRTIPLILGRPFLATGGAVIDVKEGKLVLNVNDEHVMFDIYNAMKFHDTEDEMHECHMVDMVKVLVEEQIEKRNSGDILDLCLRNSIFAFSNLPFDYNFDDLDDINLFEYIRSLDVMQELPTNKEERLLDPYKEIKFGGVFLEEYSRFPPPNLDTWPSCYKVESFKDEDKNEAKAQEKEKKQDLKPLPDHLKYAFLEQGDLFPVIVSSYLSDCELDKLLRVLREHKSAIGWDISDLKGIPPSICMHKICLDESAKPRVQGQRRLNSIMQEVVRKEVVKWLDNDIIFPISDSEWVSPTQVVPKKRG